MGDICPYGNNLPYEGLLAPVYYFYQGPVALVENIATAVTPVVVAMGDAWPVLAALAAVLMYQAQVQMNVREKLLSFFSVSWMLTYGVINYNASGEIEGLVGNGELMSILIVIFHSLFTVVSFIVAGPLALEVLISWVILEFSSCKDFSYLLSAWALYSLYVIADQEVVKGLLMWFNGSMFYIGYTVYGMQILSP